MIRKIACVIDQVVVGRLMPKLINTLLHAVRQRAVDDGTEVRSHRFRATELLLCVNCLDASLGECVDADRRRSGGRSDSAGRGNEGQAAGIRVGRDVAQWCCLQPTLMAPRDRPCRGIAPRTGQIQFGSGWQRRVAHGQPNLLLRHGPASQQIDGHEGLQKLGYPTIGREKITLACPPIVRTFLRARFFSFGGLLLVQKRFLLTDCFH